MENKNNETLGKSTVHNEKRIIAKCSVPERQELFLKRNSVTNKRYYQQEIEKNMEVDNIQNNVFNGNLFEQYEYESSSNNGNGKQYSHINITEGLDDKVYKTFRFSGYIEYCKETNISKCLIKNCERLMSARRVGNIKRHYLKVHKFIIVNDSIRSYIDNEEDTSDVQEQLSCATINLNKYINYDAILNKSVCKVPGCNTTLETKSISNVTRHYYLVHNYLMKTNEVDDWSKLKNDSLGNIFQLSKIPPIPFNDLVTYDVETSSYQCLFLNCCHILEKEWSIIKKHYYETHSIIISKDEDVLPSFFRKRQCRSLNQRYDENYVLSKQCINEQETSIKTKDENDEQPHCSTKKGVRRKLPSEGLKRKNKKFFPKNYVEYCESTNVSKCYIKNCRRLMSGLMSNNIKRHYHRVHNMVIVHRFCWANTDNKEISPWLGKHADVNPEDFVLYNEKTATCHCLFINCYFSSEMDIDIIKSHYYEKHKIILGLMLNKSRRAKQRKHFANIGEYEEDVTKNAAGIKQIFKPLSGEEKPYQSKALTEKFHQKLDLSNYVEYNKVNDYSKCLIKSCKSFLPGFNNDNIKQHYRIVHKINIGVSITLEEDEESSDNFGEQAHIKISNFLSYENESSSYHCLFVKCNKVLEKHLPTIKKHYKEIHKATIVTGSDYVIYRKRRYKELHRSHESDISDHDSFSVRNELLSDEGHSSQFSIKPSNTTDFIDEMESYSIKEEYISDNENTYTAINYENDKGTTNTTKHLTNIEITFTKREFLKLCLGLVIHHDLHLNLFEDDVYFKPLLSPYEQVFDCHINSSLLLDLMLKANSIIIYNLKEIFRNKVVCLELYVAGQEKKCLILNVRFLEGNVLYNKLIGFLPITKEGAEELPIFEYLNKFNIAKDQVYMTTLIAAVEEDDQINQICDNIYKQNPNIKIHPICYIQTILRSFVQKHYQDIKSWQKLLNFEHKFDMDLFSNLKELENYIENVSEADINLKPQLKEAKNFLKTLQILRNFIEKLRDEEYVAGDFYRDWLCCELEMKGELNNNSNAFAGKVYEDLTDCKNTLLQSNELTAALYLDARINFLGSRLLSDTQKAEGKQFLCGLWEKFRTYVQPTNSVDALPINRDSHDDNDDEYALLNQHINDMSVKSNVCIEDMITNCVSSKREPFSLDILKYWHCKRHDMRDIHELTKIVFTFSSSRYILIYLQKNFDVSYKYTDKFDKFLIKHNRNILEENLDLIFKDLK